MPSEILVKEIYFPDSKISLASFLSARLDIPLHIKFSQEKKNEDRNFTSRSSAYFRCFFLRMKYFE